MSRLPTLAGKRRWSKYGNKPVEIDGIRFDSTRESKRWQELKLLEKAGVISDLKRQVTFRLDVNGQHICRYIADMVYQENGLLIVEDVKGVQTDVFKIKAKLMKAVHGIDVRITK